MELVSQNYAFVVRRLTILVRQGMATDVSHRKVSSTYISMALNGGGLQTMFPSILNGCITYILRVVMRKVNVYLCYHKYWKLKSSFCHYRRNRL